MMRFDLLLVEYFHEGSSYVFLNDTGENTVIIQTLFLSSQEAPQIPMNTLINLISPDRNDCGC